MRQILHHLSQVTSVGTIPAVISRSDCGFKWRATGWHSATSLFTESLWNSSVSHCRANRKARKLAGILAQHHIPAKSFGCITWEDAILTKIAPESDTAFPLVIGGYAIMDRDRQIAINVQAWMQSGLFQQGARTDDTTELKPGYPISFQPTQCRDWEAMVRICKPREPCHTLW